MPQTLDERTAAPTEKEDISRVWVSFEMLLHQQRKTRHPFAHIRVSARDPDSDATRNRNHRSALNAAAAKLGGADADITTLIPPDNSIR